MQPQPGNVQAEAVLDHAAGNIGDQSDVTAAAAGHRGLHRLVVLRSPADPDPVKRAASDSRASPTSTSGAAPRLSPPRPRSTKQPVTPAGWAPPAPRPAGTRPPRAAAPRTGSGPRRRRVGADLPAIPVPVPSLRPDVHQAGGTPAQHKKHRSATPGTGRQLAEVTSGGLPLGAGRPETGEVGTLGGRAGRLHRAASPLSPTMAPARPLRNRTPRPLCVSVMLHSASSVAGWFRAPLPHGPDRSGTPGAAGTPGRRVLVTEGTGWETGRHTPPGSTTPDGAALAVFSPPGSRSPACGHEHGFDRPAGGAAHRGFG